VYGTVRDLSVPIIRKTAEDGDEEDEKDSDVILNTYNSLVFRRHTNNLYRPPPSNHKSP
jgi:hypothetical protein